MAWTTDVVTWQDADVYHVNWLGVADASELTDSIIVNLSDLRLPKTNVAPTKSEILHCTISAGGVVAYLEWEHTTDDLIVCCPPGCTVTIPPPWIDDESRDEVYDDPGSAGGTGDIVLTTLGGASGDGVSIQMAVLLK